MTEKISKWTSIVIAICALTVSISATENNILSNKLSVKPHLDIAYYSNIYPASAEVGYRIASSGLGPAIIKWAAIYVDGKIMRSWNEVNSALGLPEPFNGTFSNPNIGTSIKSGEMFATYSLIASKNVPYLNENPGRIEIKICYCSVYGEIDSHQCWQTSNVAKDIKSTCEDTPSIVWQQ